jgi:hypothetical protein
MENENDGILTKPESYGTLTGEHFALTGDTGYD